MQSEIDLVPITIPPREQWVRRDARFAAEGERRTRYSLPLGLQSDSPVGYRTRVPFTPDEAAEIAPLLSMARPDAFVAADPIQEHELFDECSLGILSSRQSTNFRGHRQVTLGPGDSQTLAGLLQKLRHCEAPVLEQAAYTHVVMGRPYRTPFTLLLTFVGHKPLLSLLTVPLRAWNKRVHHVDDIPTIGYLSPLHMGILADGMERAAVIASAGRRRANIFLAPFSSGGRQAENADVLSEIGALVGLSAADYRRGWRIRLVAQVGQTREPLNISAQTCRKLGANLLAFRSERIQPGVNAEKKAPEQYQKRQGMEVPEPLAFMAGRAAYNAFEHWSGCDRQKAKELLLMDRVDVLTPKGKEQLRGIRQDLGRITDRVVEDLPLWADLPVMKAFSRNANRGRKAFALAGQRIYIGGLDRAQVEASGLDWQHAIQAFGAAAARSALVCELSGCIELPPELDLLSGICLMAGPVNQNDIGKQFYGYPDLLAAAYPDLDPTSLLVWTLKAKTVADPIGNEEQLLNAERKGALVDLRCGPHELVFLRQGGRLQPMREHEGAHSTERAFADQDNFVADPQGKQIPGNRGEAWPDALRHAAVWGSGD